MSIFRCLVGLFAFTAFLTPASAVDPLGNGIAAIVNGKVITSHDVRKTAYFEEKRIIKKWQLV